ncbi:MAG: hypothetical protein WBA93_07560 [Microcoleaceae cyanobacterium]
MSHFLIYQNTVEEVKRIANIYDVVSDKFFLNKWGEYRVLSYYFSK